MTTSVNSTVNLAENRGPELLIIIWIFTVLTILVVGLKLFTRVNILHAFGFDDFFIIISTVSRATRYS
jgi:hypothetical protein